MNHLIHFLKNYPLLLLAAFIEGGIVMCVEVNSGNIIATYYGNSIYLWAGILGITLAGLAAGYFAGDTISRKRNQAILRLVLFAIAILTAAIPIVSDYVLTTTLAFENVKTGILVSCFLLIFPVLFLCGIVCPFVIQLITLKHEPGKTAGIVYTISTAGGIFFTFLILFVMVPSFGIKATYFIVSGLFFLVFVLAAFSKKLKRHGDMQ